MHRFNCVIAALTVVAFVSPSLAGDISKAGPNAKTEQTLPPNGEVKRDAAGGQMGGEIRGARVGSQVETRKVEPRWHRVRAEQVVIVNHRHHHHHHRDTI